MHIMEGYSSDRSVRLFGAAYDNGTFATRCKT